ncbi:MAG: septal ring lytic transglycosylase RlpA family protein [Deinococcales bacterium]|nr:septal ring lytic transglycosylase RlpA family protein [Chitinophagaceae bacterium]
MRTTAIAFILLFICLRVYCQIPDTAPVVQVSKYKIIKGKASFYSLNLHGTKTSTGETFDNNKMTAASNSFKMNTWVLVTNLSNDKTVIVRINDRMHPKMAKKGRVIDLSHAAAKKLGFLQKGITKVEIEPIDKPKNK